MLCENFLVISFDATDSTMHAQGRAARIVIK